MRVFVYRNLHKGCLSVRDVKTRRVIAHVDSIVLSDCQFKVSQKGRERVLRERVKNVHAGVQGEWVQDHPEGLSLSERVIYDPYRFKTFVSARDHAVPCLNSAWAVVSTQGAWVQSVAGSER